MTLAPPLPCRRLRLRLRLRRRLRLRLRLRLHLLPSSSSSLLPFPGFPLLFLNFYCRFSGYYASWDGMNLENEVKNYRIIDRKKVMDLLRSNVQASTNLICKTCCQYNRYLGGGWNLCTTLFCTS